MSCPDIYLGPSYGEAPPDPYWTNAAISPTTTSLTQGVPVSIQVTVRNHGTDQAPPTLLELFWSDPTTGFAADYGRLIGAHTFQEATEGHPVADPIPGATLIPPVDGEQSAPFAWTPGVDALGTNGGHVCLLGRVEMVQAPGGGCTQQTYSLPPPTDPRSAIRNVHVYAPPPPPPEPEPSPGNAGFAMNFAFAATNILWKLADTKLTVRALDPHSEKDQRQLQGLVADRAVHDLLAKRRLRFAVPETLAVGMGRERARIPLSALVGKYRRKVEVPRLQLTGPVEPKVVEYVLDRGVKLTETRGRPTDLYLVPGEMQQTLLQVRPGKDEHAVYAVAVEHSGADGTPIGGLTVLFVPPYLGFERLVPSKGFSRLQRSTPSTKVGRSTPSTKVGRATPPTKRGRGKRG